MNEPEPVNEPETPDSGSDSGVGSGLNRIGFRHGMRADVLIAGAGPAGCAAAVAARIAAPALRVVVVDAARFPREKLCAGAITGGGLRELELAGLALRVPHAVASHAVLRIGGSAVRVELPRAARVVERIRFDADLVAQARESGAEVIEGAALEALRPGERVAETGVGPIAFGALVCADGASGASRRALGLAPGLRVPLREALVVGRGQGDLVFDLDAGLAGYAWRFPCLAGGVAAENCGVYALGSDPDLAPALSRWASREGIAARPPKAWSIRLAEPGGPVGKNGALLAGEALGADAAAGEGIRYALWSGRIAGRLAARAAAAGRRPSLLAYRARLAATRSGLLLALAARLGPRLHLGLEERRLHWCAAASNRQIVEALSDLVSGAAPVGPLLSLLWHGARLEASRPWRRLQARNE